ncbi:hypothetical protein B0H13DRAFT_2453702 [Mycena leptocephala]|nr:hypothetical protein B0H13DRAFT_2453702 [Mycena leptocephala]
MKGVFSRDVGRGFLAENDLVLVDNATQISLSSIPKLLQRLDLPPDDAQIGDTDTEEAYVSRDNWRAVCAVLLDDYDENDGVGVVEGQLAVDDGPWRGDEGEYLVQMPLTLTRTDTRKSHPLGGVLALLRNGSPSGRLRRASRPTRSSPPRRKKNCLTNVQQLSKLIGTKLKGTSPNFYEFLTYMFIEMLSEFSTSPDKLMSFAEFGDMMWAVELCDEDEDDEKVETMLDATSERGRGDVGSWTGRAEGEVRGLGRTESRRLGLLLMSSRRRGDANPTLGKADTPPHRWNCQLAHSAHLPVSSGEESHFLLASSATL